LAPFAITMPVALFILDMQFLWVYADDLIGKGLDPLVIAELMMYASARLVNLALPLGILVASIMALGSLAEKNELTALKSAGMSLNRILRPLVATMLLISIGAFWFSNAAWPVANLKFRTLLFSVTKKRPALNLQEGVFYNGIEGFAIRVDEKDEDGTLHDVLIHDHREGTTGVSRVMRSERGRMDQVGERLVLTMINGNSYEEDLEQSARRKERLHPHIVTNFDTQTFEIDLASLDFSKVDEGLFKRAHEMMTIAQLSAAMDSLEGLKADRYRDVALYGMRQTTLIKDSLTSVGSVIATGNILNLLSPTQKRMAFDGARSLCRNTRQGIANALDDAESKGKLKDRHAIEWHRKFFLATSCLLLFFIGAPLGAIIRKGGLGMPTVLAILIFLFYYILSIVGEQMVRAGELSPSVGMWMSTVVLLPGAIYLTRRAVRDAHVFSWSFPKWRLSKKAAGH
jgi:lipopolysaccharide export system permease protein